MTALGWELVGAGILLLAIFQLVIGRRENTKLIKGYRESMDNVLGQLFAISRHYADSANEVISYATGRLSVDSLSTRLCLRLRHDVVRSIMGLLNNWWSAAKHSNYGDQVDFEAVMPARNSAGFVLALCRQSAVADLKSERYDLATFTRLIPCVTSLESILCDGYCLLGDDAAAASGGILCQNLFNDQVLKETIKGLGSSIHSLIISSVSTDKPATLEEFAAGEMRINLRLIISAGSQLIAQSNLGTNFAVYMADRVANNFTADQVPIECRQKFSKQQRIAKESLERQLKRQQQEELEKEAERRRLELKQKQQEELDKLPRDARRKLEEKEMRKEMKRRLQRQTKVVK